MMVDPHFPASPRGRYRRPGRRTTMRTPAMRRERSVPSLGSRLLRACAAAAAVLLFAAGCMRPLAHQHEFFAPGSGVAALATVKTGHALSHHRALQAAQRACGPPALADAPGPGSERPVSESGPDPGHAAALRALAGVCAGTVADPGPVDAHGATSNAFRRWTEDQVRELPAPSETAASAAGG